MNILKRRPVASGRRRRQSVIRGGRGHVSRGGPMRPQDVLASVEPERWDEILTTVRESCPDLWRDLEKTAMADQRVPVKLWQRYSPDQRRTTMRRTLRAPASARIALDAVREYLL